MSKSMFASSRNAVGFAGVILVIAVVAAFAASAFMPLLQTEQEPVVEDVAEAAPPKPRPTQAAAGWADEEFGDDWGAEATDPVAEPASSGRNNAEIDEPGFGDYAPDTDRGGSRRASGGSSTRTSVQSGAAPGAPKLQAPVSGDSAPPGQLAMEY